jgi:hypothetical protein
MRNHETSSGILVHIKGKTSVDTQVYYFKEIVNKDNEEIFKFTKIHGIQEIGITHNSDDIITYLNLKTFSIDMFDSIICQEESFIKKLEEFDNGEYILFYNNRESKMYTVISNCVIGKIEDGKVSGYSGLESWNFTCIADPKKENIFEAKYDSKLSGSENYESGFLKRIE